MSPAFSRRLSSFHYFAVTGSAQGFSLFAHVGECPVRSARSRTAGSKSSNQFALHHWCGGSACFPYPHQHSMFWFGFYVCYFPPQEIRAPGQHERWAVARGGSHFTAGRGLCAGEPGYCHVSFARAAASLLAVELATAAVLGNQSHGGSSVRLFPVDFSLELQVPCLVCEPSTFLGLARKLPHLSGVWTLVELTGAGWHFAVLVNLLRWHRVRTGNVETDLS